MLQLPYYALLKLYELSALQHWIAAQMHLCGRLEGACGKCIFYYKFYTNSIASLWVLDLSAEKVVIHNIVVSVVHKPVVGGMHANTSCACFQFQHMFRKLILPLPGLLGNLEFVACFSVLNCSLGIFVKIIYCLRLSGSPEFTAYFPMAGLLSVVK